jgi:hypothetical protein
MRMTVYECSSLPELHHPRQSRILATAAEVRQLSVIVASKNAVKINAVAAAVKRALPGIKHTVTGAQSTIVTTA